MTPSRLSPLPPDVALALSPASISLLVSSFVAFAPALAAFDRADPLAVAEALSYRLVPAALADLLADVTRLATPLGREATLELLPSSASSLVRLPAADLAAHLLSPGSRALPRRAAAAIRARALVRVARHFSPRPWLTLLWPRAELPSPPHDWVERSARAIHGPSFVRAWIASLEGTVLRAIVVYRGPAERLVTHSGNPPRLRARSVRPLACDVIRWDARDGRVSFCLARPALLTDWARAVGEACVGDARAFSDRPAYTHKSLHVKGDEWLARVPLPRGVRKLDVIAGEVDDGKVVRVRSDAALTRLHEVVGRARGYLRSTTLRFEVDEGDAPVDATIELPWKVLLSDGRYEEELRAIMDALEMLEPGSLPDDLPSLAPMQPEWRWADLLTAPLFARALELGVLARVRGKRPSDRAHRRWGSLLRAFDVPGEDAAYVVGEDIAIRAFDAKPEALVWCAIDWTRMAQVLRAELGLDEARVTDAPGGLLSIGELATPAARVAVFALTRALGENEVMPLLKQLRHACGRAVPAVIVPRGRSLGGAVAEVEVLPAEQLGVADIASLAGRIAEECGLGDDVEPWRFGTKDAPLVLSVARSEAWYGRVKLLVTENQLAMLFALARAADWMKSTELGNKIAPQAGIPDQIVRKARLTLVERLAQSFKEAGSRMPKGLGETIVSYDRTNGYRLGVKAIVR